MRRVASWLSAIALVALASTPALAAGGDEGPGVVLPAINLLILLAVLVYFARKPIQAYFAERRDEISGDIESAAELKKDAEERFAKWQRKLAHLEAELDEIRTQARERAESEREHILADARASAERIRRDATTAIEQEVRRAQEGLRGEASELAVELAAGLLRDQVGDADRERLLDEFIGRIESPTDSTQRPNGGAS